ncbi:MAG: hypothetical protein VZR00_02705 [Lachnospiraceae bacterium]|jgi:hypothetical protein|nr:hypothetical protein [Lachnospiraceae bacterium]MEE3460786.1 hypothetical protein [Lachnospiraceae bacterium]
MGFFDKLKKQVAGESPAQMVQEYRNLPVETLCHKLNDSKNPTQVEILSNIIKNKAEDMADDELKKIFDKVYLVTNPDVYGCFMPEMQKRNLIFKDAEGKTHKNY